MLNVQDQRWQLEHTGAKYQQFQAVHGVIEFGTESKQLK